jgi:hypothetical protein
MKGDGFCIVSAKDDETRGLLERIVTPAISRDALARLVSALRVLGNTETLRCRAMSVSGFRRTPSGEQRFVITGADAEDECNVHASDSVGVATAALRTKQLRDVG